MKKYFLTAVVYSMLFGCEGAQKPSVDDLTDMGYREFQCTDIEYSDLKADDDNPHIRIFSKIERINPELEVIAARCYSEYLCDYEVIKRQEILCQKYILLNNEDFEPFWSTHKILVFNAKNYM